MKTLEDALFLAIEAHQDQRDKYDAPAILHPIRVMGRVETMTEKMVSLLHDVVEDSDITLGDLAEAGYPPKVVHAVDHLTKRPGEAYDSYIRRIRPHPLARRVKIADLRDNMDIRRLPLPPWGEQEFARLQRYRRAWETLTAVGQEEDDSKP
jgi:hypothetical protein